MLASAECVGVWENAYKRRIAAEAYGLMVRGLPRMVLGCSLVELRP